MSSRKHGAGLRPEVRRLLEHLADLLVQESENHPLALDAHERRNNGDHEIEETA